MWNLFLQIVAGILGLWLADRFISGVEFTGPLQALALAGAVLGLINFFIKPILKAITLPLRIITFGLFGIVINMVLVWMVDILFTELTIRGLIALVWTSLIIWGLGFFLTKWMPEKKK